jgi:hypothetical protein
MDLLVKPTEAFTLRGEGFGAVIRESVVIAREAQRSGVDGIGFQALFPEAGGQAIKGGGFDVHGTLRIPGGGGLSWDNTQGLGLAIGFTGRS